MKIDPLKLLSGLHLCLTIGYFVLSWRSSRRAQETGHEPSRGLELLIIGSVASGALWLDFNSAQARAAWPWLYLLSLICAWGCIEWRRRAAR